ncbi:Ig-like domain-containing protein [Pleionea sediminis]|uniref:Ig-like domain-containing protein n=1 Tax=Pleionea sediminis TaxID=2569479 RepID=UPI001184A63D|nr:Ig-like domain-containing protein [Pleionea sediminis]
MKNKLWLIALTSALVLSGCKDGGSGSKDPSKIDSDGDGVVDSQDAFPNDPTETTDTDGDGIGNNADTDDDNDGHADINDDAPLDPNIFDLTAPMLTEFTPEDGTTNMAFTTSVSATFNEPMAVESFGAGFTFTNPGGSSVETTTELTNNDQTVTLTPVSKLALHTTYTANLTTDVTDAQGNNLANGQSWSFTTQDGAWTSNREIDLNEDALPNFKGAIRMQVAYDNSGDGLAIWEIRSSDVRSLMASTYDAEFGWSAPEFIETNEDDIGYPKMSMNANGNAIVTWMAYQEGGASTLWTNTFFKGEGWGAPQKFEARPTRFSHENHDVVLKNDGTAIIAWTPLLEENVQPLLSMQFNIEEKLGAIVELDSNRSIRPSFAKSNNDEIALVWQMLNVNWSAASKILSEENAWSDTTILDNNEDASVYDIKPKAAINNLGNIIVAWTRYNPDADTESVWANYYSSSEGWSGEQQVTTTAYVAYGSDIVLSNTNKGTLVWIQSNNEDEVRSLYSSQFDAGSGWTTPELIESNDIGDIDTVQLKQDANGNIFAVWKQRLETFTKRHLWVKRLTSEGWLTEFNVDPTAGSIDNYDLAFTTRGEAILIWNAWNGEMYQVFNKFFTEALR